jgi:hypothetical protein
VPHVDTFTADQADQTPAEKRASMTGFCSCKTGIHALPGNNLGKAIETRLQYRNRLKAPTLGETCSECGGDGRIIASIEDPVVIQKILAHLESIASSAATALLPDCRASPSLPEGLFD